MFFNGNQGWGKEGEEGKKEDGDMILQLSSVRHGLHKQKTGVFGKNMMLAYSAKVLGSKSAQSQKISSCHLTDYACCVLGQGTLLSFISFT